MSENASDALMQAMQILIEKGQQVNQTLLMPPPFVESLGMEVTAFEKGQMLAASFPYDQRYANPLGLYLGGMICALIDAVMGPLSYTVFDLPAVTTEFTTTYVRPFSARDERLIVTARVIATTKTQIILDAEAKTPAGKLVTLARSTSAVVRPERG